ncbi:MAG: hypothetical protein WKG07_05650 [Hymenobacter sp.]
MLTLLLSLGAGAARAAGVTFNVNMQYQIRQGNFVAGTDQVVVLGSFSAAGVALSDPDGRPGVLGHGTEPDRRRPTNLQLPLHPRWGHGARNRARPALRGAGDFGGQRADGLVQRPATALPLRQVLCLHADRDSGRGGAVCGQFGGWRGH